MADPHSIDDAFVLQAARLAGIDITAEQLQSVVGHLRRTAEAARLVDEFPLGTEEEPGPVWQP